MPRYWKYLLLLPLALAMAFSACAPQAVPAITPAPSAPPEDGTTPSSEEDTALDPPPQDAALKEEAAQQDAEAGKYRALSAQQAKQRIDDEEDILIVDVRTQAEYEAGHIPGAILIPNETIGTQPPERLPDTSAVILLYCRSGNRSRQAAYKLLKMGYTQVFDFGGINSWPYETVTGPES